jgi:hypothetical protein
MNLLEYHPAGSPDIINSFYAAAFCSNKCTSL